MSTLPRKFRQFLFLFLGTVVGFITSIVPASPVAAFGGGAGTAGDPYQISTCAQLLEIDDSTANLSKSYLLTAKIGRAHV